MCLDSMSGGSKRHHVMEVETIHPKSCLVEPAKEGLEHQAQQHSASAIETHRAENQASTPCFSDREPTFIDITTANKNDCRWCFPRPLNSTIKRAPFTGHELCFEITPTTTALFFLIKIGGNIIRCSSVPKRARENPNEPGNTPTGRQKH